MQVNNQMVVGTLMNICDAPNQVSIGQEWRPGDWVKRIPIIVTGNDFSKVFAPLVREGRMSKFYWRPEREELIAILHQMYKVRLSTLKRDAILILEQSTCQWAYSSPQSPLIAVPAF